MSIFDTFKNLQSRYLALINTQMIVLIISRYLGDNKKITLKTCTNIIIYIIEMIINITVLKDHIPYFSFESNKL